MDVETMHIGVNLRVQKIDSNAYDNLLDQEIDSYLNKAIFEFIKSRITPRSNIFGEGFEQSAKRWDDLRTLVKKNANQDTTQVTSDGAIESFFVDRAVFPDDYMFGLSARFKVQYNEDGVTFTLSAGKRVVDGAEGTDYDVKDVFGKIIQQDDIYQILLDPFNTTRINQPVYDVNDSGIDVYTDNTFIVDRVLLNYIKEPATVSVDRDTPSNSVDCDLPDQTHEEIVDMAARMILGDIGQFGPEGQLQELSKTE